MTVKIFTSHSAKETKAFGKKLARTLKKGDVVALHGELGTGKTTLVKGIAQGFGINPDKVSSPTFVVIHEYKWRTKIFHIDWYRLARVEGVDASLAEEGFRANAVTLIEWPERGKALLPRKHICVKLEHGGQNKRIIQILRG